MIATAGLIVATAISGAIHPAARGRHTSHRAVSIAAPVERVWPWIIDVDRRTIRPNALDGALVGFASW